MNMRDWMKRGAALGFVFFFLKGLVWLIIAIAVAIGIF